MTDDDRRPHTTVRLVDPTHARLKDHCREGETLSGAVDRALDALEREQELPEAVTAAMGVDPDWDPYVCEECDARTHASALPPYCPVCETPNVMRAVDSVGEADG